jgi:hypothetical protein
MESVCFSIIFLKKEFSLFVLNNQQILRILFLPFLILLIFAHDGLAYNPAIGSNDGIGTYGKLKTVSGYIKDAKNGEPLAGATIHVLNSNIATSANADGFYSLSLATGKYTLEFSYVGYKTDSINIELKENQTINVELSEAVHEIEEIIVKGESVAEKIRKPEMSVSKLESKTIKKIPALMGETDVIKVIQLLPGVQTTSEGSSGFSVRGGGIDQNLIILDDAPLYNPSHLMGFFSVFNNDAVKDVKLYKGDLPAYYGGRLSSVLDVKMKEGNLREWSGNAGIGLISSRAMIEGPIIKDKTSMLLAVRRTYADLFFPLMTDTNLKKSYMYFYDVNLKISHQINSKNRILLSGYLGQDIYGQKKGSKFDFGNKMLSLRWNSQLSGIVFSNLTVFATNYSYHLTTGYNETSLFWNSNISDLGINLNMTLSPDPNNEIRFGISSIYHSINPVKAWLDEDTTNYDFPSLLNHSLEHGVYITNQQKIGDKLTLKYGLRYSIFQNMGKTLQYYYDSNHQFLYSKDYKSGDIYHTYSGLEPRLGINYVINDKSSIKASYSRSYQYLQLASNTNGGLPLDYWFPASPNIRPQKGDQYAIGYLRNLAKINCEFSVETFYKTMNNVIDFEDHAQLLLNDQLEGTVRSGDAYSYGIELMLRRTEGKLNGWISYTYSRAFRKIPEINEGKKYPAPYDKPNNVYIVLNYDITKYITVSANWIYATGTPITFPVGSFRYGNNLFPIYSSRNAYRMRDYHRLDFSVNIKEKNKTLNLWQGEWVFSMYNAYGRHNDWMINFENDDENGVEYKKAVRWYLPFIYFPSITYNMYF